MIAVEATVCAEGVEEVTGNAVEVEEGADIAVEVEAVDEASLIISDCPADT